MPRPRSNRKPPVVMDLETYLNRVEAIRDATDDETKAARNYVTKKAPDLIDTIFGTQEGPEAA